ncbi:MAG: sensor histidine kinase [Cyanobacteria bacterium J06650_10]
MFIVACLVTDLSYSKILFLPILLYSYLAISQRLSYLLAIIGVTTLLAFSLFNVNGIGLVPPPPRPNPIPNTASPRNRPSRSGRLLDESMGLLITLFFTLLLARAISQSTQAQQRLTKLLASLEASHMQLQQYSTRVADLAATEERNRLARDIHDSLGHHLAAINIQLEKANAYRERDPKRAREAVNLAQHTVQDALKDVRASVSSLRKGSEPFLFGESLNDLIDRMRHSELMIVSSQSGDSSRYSRLKLMTLYRVVQEGLTNVHKHAHATQVTIEIAFDDRQVTLSLRDDGDGFDVKAWKTRNNKQMTEQMTQGLIGLQERLSLVGGTLSITSYPYDGYAPNLSSKRSQRSPQNLSPEKTQGTTLTVCIPRSSSYLHSNTEVRS